MPEVITEEMIWGRKLTEKEKKEGVKKLTELLVDEYNFNKAEAKDFMKEIKQRVSYNNRVNSK